MGKNVRLSQGLWVARQGWSETPGGLGACGTGWDQPSRCVEYLASVDRSKGPPIGE